MPMVRAMLLILGRARFLWDNGLVLGLCIAKVVEARFDEVFGPCSDVPEQLQATEKVQA